MFPCIVIFYTFAKLFSKSVDYINKYKIAFKGLKEGDHLFEYDLDDRFFERFENSQVANGQLKAKVQLNKQATLMSLGLAIEGQVTLQCDRCLDDYQQPVKNKSRMYVKFGQESEDMGDEIIVLPFDEYQLDVSYYLYELVILGLPIKHVHPDDKKGKSTCNPEMMEKLKDYLINEGNEVANEDENIVIDERWKELRKLLDNK